MCVLNPRQVSLILYKSPTITVPCSVFQVLTLLSYRSDLIHSEIGLRGVVGGCRGSCNPTKRDGTCFSR